MKYEPVVGLEVHLQLKTKTKMFCGCINDPFRAEKPNIYVCPICLGLPGALPVPNREAVIMVQKFAYALKSKLGKQIIFERKNYFYPDLPKGYQITSPHYPIGRGGELSMSYWNHRKGKSFAINLREIHLEEDTAKSLHREGKTWIDFNKSGVPLLEIVTEPDFRDIDLAVQFCKELQLTARYLDISEASMEKGHMRLEANISVREKDQKELPGYRIELKNLNSFNFMRKALRHELRRQIEALGKGETLYQETRGFNENTGETFVQRTKEEAHDYRYFPEPDIPPLEFNDKWLGEIATSVGVLPSDRRHELEEQNLNAQYINVLVRNLSLFEKHQKLLDLGYSPSKAADMVINVAEYKGRSVEEIDKLERIKQGSKVKSEGELLPVVQEVISENKKAVEDYVRGNENSIQFLIGQVMKKTKGRADPTKVRKFILRLLTQ